MADETTQESNGAGQGKTRREMIGLSLPPHLMDKVERTIERRGYATKAEFVRRAVVTKLESLGMLED